MYYGFSAKHVPINLVCRPLSFSPQKRGMNLILSLLRLSKNRRSGKSGNKIKYSHGQKICKVVKSKFISVKMKALRPNDTRIAINEKYDKMFFGLQL